MPSSYGRRVATVVFVLALTFSMTARAATSIPTAAQILLRALVPPNAIVPTPAPSTLTPPPPPTVPTTAAPTTATLTASAKATLIASLTAEVKTLEAEIAALIAAQNTPCTAVNLTRSLALGSQGTDVTQLQNFLIS